MSSTRTQVNIDGLCSTKDAVVIDAVSDLFKVQNYSDLVQKTKQVNIKLFLSALYVDFCDFNSLVCPKSVGTRQDEKIRLFLISQCLSGYGR